MTIRSTRVLTGGRVQPATVSCQDGIISSISSLSPADHDFGGLLVLPGMIDAHVHVNEPGRTEWEGFESAGRSAAAGGFTSLADMPLNCLPAVTTASALELKRSAAEKCVVETFFWGGVVPDDIDHIPSLAAAGVNGFKCFLTPPGLSGFEMLTEADLHRAMPLIAHTGLPLLVHAELPEFLVQPAGDPLRYETYLESRPERAEVEAIRLMIRLCRQYACR